MFVCLGWGSLIWDLAGLPVERLEPGRPVPRWVLSPEGEDIGDWKPDGPQVRVEFARQSGKERDRLTLVLSDAAERQPSFWARMTVATLGEAVRALTKRECRGISERRIDRWSKDNIGRWSEGRRGSAGHPWPERLGDRSGHHTRGLDRAAAEVLRSSGRTNRRPSRRVSQTTLRRWEGYRGGEVRAASATAGRYGVPSTHHPLSRVDSGRVDASQSRMRPSCGSPPDSTQR